MTPQALTLWLSTAAAELKDGHGFAGRPAPAVVQAIADAAVADPLMGDEQHTAAILLVFAFRESSYRADVRGDSGKSCGLFQSPCASTPLRDPKAQATIALRIMRRSMTACPDFPFAVYASGSCASAAGRRISSERIADAKRLVASVPTREP
jgi:hypothetical protein